MSSSALQTRLRPLSSWLAKYVNAHRFLWLMSLLCFLIAWNRGIALLYGLLALMLSLIAISWLMPWWSLRRLSLSRQQLGQATAGRTLQLQYEFATPAPVFFLRICEQIPGNQQAPAESRCHFLARAAAGEAVTLSYPCEQRGVFLLPAPQLSCAWPFGFVERHVRVPVAGSHIVVAPKTFRIRQLPLPASGNPVLAGADSFLPRSAHSDFAGVRDYRAGDSLKTVHWAASARQQQLVVREYHSYDTPCWLVVVDGQQGNALGDGADNTFEYAIQIAASMLRYAQRQQLKLTLVVGGRRPLKLTLDAGAQNIAEALLALAYVQDDGSQSYQQLVTQTLAEAQEPPLLMTIRRASQPLTLPGTRAHLDVVYNDDSFRQPLQQYAEGWRQTADGVMRLDLHRLSKLHQVFSA